jgi:hypothetical protein
VFSSLVFKKIHLFFDNVCFNADGSCEKGGRFKDWQSYLFKSSLLEVSLSDGNKGEELIFFRGDSVLDTSGSMNHGRLPFINVLFFGCCILILRDEIADLTREAGWSMIFEFG